MLRKIISGFRRQDWTAVAVELVVVIAGVFIGVQASNWNAQRETDQKAAVFTARLKAPGEAVNRSAELRHRGVLRAGVPWIRSCRTAGVTIGRCCHD